MIFFYVKRMNECKFDDYNFERLLLLLFIKIMEFICMNVFVLDV